jgi:hypothetical protein
VEDTAAALVRGALRQSEHRAPPDTEKRRALVVGDGQRITS